MRRFLLILRYWAASYLHGDCRTQCCSRGCTSTLSWQMASGWCSALTPLQTPLSQARRLTQQVMQWLARGCSPRTDWLRQCRSSTRRLQLPRALPFVFGKPGTPFNTLSLSYLAHCPLEVCLQHMLRSLVRPAPLSRSPPCLRSLASPTSWGCPWTWGARSLCHRTLSC